MNEIWKIVFSYSKYLHNAILFLIYETFGLINHLANIDSSRDALFYEGATPFSESRQRSLALTGMLLVLFSTMTPNNWTAFKFTY